MKVLSYKGETDNKVPDQTTKSGFAIKSQPSTNS